MSEPTLFPASPVDDPDLIVAEPARCDELEHRPGCFNADFHQTWCLCGAVQWRGNVGSWSSQPAYDKVSALPHTGIGNCAVGLQPAERVIGWRNHFLPGACRDLGIDASRAVDRFNPAGPAGYRAKSMPDAPLREFRQQAEQDERSWVCRDCAFDCPGRAA